MYRRALTLTILLSAFPVSPAPVAAQQVVPTALDSARTYPRKPKSMGTAVVLSLLLPGSGQIYAQQSGRELLTMAAYFPAAIIVSNGRTDALGKVAGVAALSLYVFSLVDAVKSVNRYNRALDATPRESHAESHAAMRRVPQFVEAPSSSDSVLFPSRVMRLCSCRALRLAF